jgi:hypothetical protein
MSNFEMRGIRKDKTNKIEYRKIKKMDEMRTEQRKGERTKDRIKWGTNEKYKCRVTSKRENSIK